MVVLVSISLATITLDYRQGAEGPLAGFGRTTVSFMAPFQRAVTNLTRPIGNFFSGLAHLPSLSADNRRFKEEIAGLRSDKQAVTDLQHRVDELSALLDLKESLGSVPTVAAAVIANGVSNFEWTVTIDRGGSDGVSVDDPVVASGNRLVGRVISVTSDASVVQLMIDRDFSVAGKLSAANEAGLIQGQGADDMRMTLVDPAVEVAADETVVTTSYRAPGGQGGVYPPGITIGQVARVLPGSNALQKFITIRPAVDFSSLEFVLILTVGSIT